MYLIERPPAADYTGQEYQDYYFVGDDQERQRFVEGVGAAALGAAAIDAIGISAPAEIFASLSRMDVKPLRVWRGSALCLVLSDFDRYADQRKGVIIMEAVAGHLSTAAAMAECKHIDTLNIDIQDATSAVIDKDGLQSGFTPDGLEVRTGDVADPPFDQEGAGTMLEVARRLEADLCGVQYAVSYHKPTASQPFGSYTVGRLRHFSVGNNDADGAFVPLATVLNPMHPARWAPYKKVRNIN